MSKIRNLPEQTSAPGTDDLLYVVDSSTGPNAGKKIKYSTLRGSLLPTGAEVKSLYEGNADTNAFTDAEKAKLAGVEAGATADQTAAEIKTAYESNPDTNAFTDAEKTKLAGVEAGATADQTAAEIKTAYESNPDTNAFTDAEQTKLAGIEAGATADQSAAEVPYSNTSSGLAATNAQTAIDEVNAEANGEFKVTVSSGLIVNFAGGKARFNGTFYTVASGSLLLGANITNGRIYVDIDGVVKSGATAPTYSIPIASFTTNVSAITALADIRVRFTQNLVSGNQEANATADDNTASLTDVLMVGMTQTPVAGTYLVIWSGAITNSGNGAERAFVSLYFNGTQVTATERGVGVAGGAYVPVSTQGIVTVNGSQAIELRWRSVGGTSTVRQRKMTLLRVG
jgi:hypothetical protein